jgi:3-oxo-5-alpha-steroid 4-dehydrogenase 1
MDEITSYYALLAAFAFLSVVIFVTLLFFPAPYGRFARKGFGPILSDRFAWVIMELPAPTLMAYWFWTGKNQGIVQTVFFLAFELHYVLRTFIYPFAVRRSAKKTPLGVAVMGFAFNCVNSYLIGRYLFHLAPENSPYTLFTPHFIAGAILFVAGMAINWHSDILLSRFAKQAQGEYQIPKGGLFLLVTKANYFGECLEWLGFAIMTWALPALVFALWTFANLAPRALHIHRYYLANFKDYPRNRKALIPFLF